MQRGSCCPWHWLGRVHLPPGRSLGHWDGVRTVTCTDASSCTPQGPTGLVSAPPGASWPSARTSLCSCSTAASPPVPEQSCVKHADVFIAKLMAALRACAYPVLFKSVPEQPFPATAKQKLFQQNPIFLFSVRNTFFFFLG